jgi:hypothetical protein
LKFDSKDTARFGESDAGLVAGDALVGLDLQTFEFKVTLSLLLSGHSDTHKMLGMESVMDH